MKISKVVIRRFKRFEDTEFDVPSDGIIFAGPNNTGKTTLLQAIATWSLAMRHWLALEDYNARNGYAKAPLTRQAFYSVPLQNFNLLWHGGKPKKRHTIQIELYFVDSVSCTMEIAYDTTEQIYVRPVYGTPEQRDFVKSITVADEYILPKVVYVPAMTGITMEEPLYQPAKIDELLGQGRPGEVLRNLLVQAAENEDAWKLLHKTIDSLFGYEILPPQTSGANIIAEYIDNNGLRLDIASAGSGFLQILMLLTFFSANKKSVLLLDEPDAHLHILLQEKIVSVLKDFADESDSTLILATHSERIINITEPENLSVVLDNPTPILDKEGRDAVITALKVLDNTDIALAKGAKKILYVEGYTDIDLLLAWAEVLDHHLFGFLNLPYWRPTVYQPVGKERGRGIQASEHYGAIRLAVRDIRGLELRDSDGRKRPNTQSKNGLKRIFWRRYEIESYLIHPDAIIRFAKTIGEQGTEEKVRKYLKKRLRSTVYNNPLGGNSYFDCKNAKQTIDGAMKAAGIGDSKKRHLIAKQMNKEEIHPEVIEKLDMIAEHFDISKNSNGKQ